MEDDNFPQQEPAFIIQGLRHRPPEGRGGETGVPAAAGQEDAVPGSRNGPDRCKQPHFRFRAGEPILGSERVDRRRSRSPEKQEAARKRHRNLKN